MAGYGSPIAAHWRNGRWSVSPLSGKLLGELEAVSADGPRDAWAVSVANVLHWHHGRWTVARSWSLRDGPPGFQATGITAFSPTNVWVFGGTAYWQGLGTWHLRGRTWTRVRGIGGTVFEASALSARNMWAVGGRNATAILHYSGGKWRQVLNKALVGRQFNDIYASSPTSVWVTASPANGSIGSVLLHMTGGHWTGYAIPWRVQLQVQTALISGGLSPDGRGGFWIPTESYSGTKWILHFRAGKWTRVSIGTSPIGGPVLIPGTRSLWGTGYKPDGRGTNGLIWAYGRVG